LIKFFKNLETSLDFLQGLFDGSHLNVTQGKKVQRKVRYEQMKEEFLEIINNATIPTKEAPTSMRSNSVLLTAASTRRTHSKNRNSIFTYQRDSNSSLCNSSKNFLTQTSNDHQL